MIKQLLRRRLKAALTLGLVALMGVMSATSIPASAHRDHKRKQEAAQHEAERAAAGPSLPAEPMTHPAMPDQAGAMAAVTEAEEPPQSFATRLLDWLGRFHPMLVHFPIAFIPAALFAAIVGRKRTGFAKPVQLLVVTAGVTAPFAMLSGWLSGGLDVGVDDWVMQSHRWLGTGIGIGALALGVHALKRPDEDRGTGMIVGLSILTAAILAQ